MVLIIMGVAGSGKSTIGQMLARLLSAAFYDGDDLHPAENRDKMRRGVPLTDEDRRPRLKTIRALVDRCLTSGINAVIACSALKRQYRDAIIIDPKTVRVVYLKGARELIVQRLEQRRGHFFRTDLLESQLNTLEEPSDAIVEDISRAPQMIVDSICAKLGR
jgi:gluconokinase